MVTPQYPRPGDIYHLNLSPSGGSEQAGKHYALVVSAGKFNKASGMPFFAPITPVGNKFKALGIGVNLTGAGTSVTGTIQVDQIKALDWRKRGGTPTGEKVPDYIMDEVLTKFGLLFGLYLPEDEEEE